MAIPYHITKDDIKYLKYNKGLVIDYIVYVAANSYPNYTEDFIKDVVEDSLKYFPNILRITNVENLNVVSYTSQIIRSSIVKHWENAFQIAFNSREIFSAEEKCDLFEPGPVEIF